MQLKCLIIYGEEKMWYQEKQTLAKLNEYKEKLQFCNFSLFYAMRRLFPKITTKQILKIMQEQMNINFEDYYLKFLKFEQRIIKYCECFDFDSCYPYISERKMQNRLSEANILIALLSGDVDSEYYHNFVKIFGGIENWKN